jgi:hypothetical protein
VGGVLRWLVVAVLVVGAVATTYLVQPMTCHVEMCDDNVLADLGIVLVGVIAAILVLTVSPASSNVVTLGPRGGFEVSFRYRARAPAAVWVAADHTPATPLPGRGSVPVSMNRALVRSCSLAGTSR